MAENLNAALRYARVGFRVLRVHGLRDGVCTCHKGAKCESPGKHAADTGWDKLATRDAKKIKALFERRPNAHVGVMPPKGHWFLDVDVRNGGDKTLKALMNGSRLPDTPMQRSGGGGAHYLFAGTPPGSLGPGLDVITPSKYVVAAPSGHVSGRRYKWERPPWDLAAAPTPKWLHREPSQEMRPAPSAKADVPLDQVRAALAHVSADDYQRWINFGQALKHNYGDEGESVWLEWSKASSKYRDGDEAKWDTFDRNRDRPLITVRSIISIARRNGYRPLAKEFDQGLWALADITDPYSNPAPPLDWVMEPCIPAGKVTLLAGAGGSSKSYLALTLAMQLAIGEEFGPFKPSKPGKALLLVSEEDKEDVSRRFDAIRKARMYTEAHGELITERVGVLPVRGMDWRLVYHDEAGDLHETERVQYLIDEIKALGDVRLIVLDPLVAFNGAHENDNMEMARLMFTFDRIAASTGAAVLVLHHVSKGGQQTNLNETSQAVVRGASALVDNARAAMVLTKMPRGEAAQYNIAPDDAGRFVVARVVKNNYGPHTTDVVFAVEAGGALRLAPEVRRVHASAAQAQREQVAAAQPVQVLRAMLDKPDSTQRELATACLMSKGKLFEVVKDLLEDGYVKRIGVGTRCQYAVTKSGREAAGASDVSDLL